MLTYENVLQQKLLNLGIVLDLCSGHLFYHPEFTPLQLHYELLFIRHGETYGNCGQVTSQGTIDKKLVQLNIKNSANRIYQGCVDEAINQLTPLGITQANNVAILLEKNFLRKGWIPDDIFYSPLLRAKQTALPYIKDHNLWSKFHVHEGIQEISFGTWDNRRICDIETPNDCHLFYLCQHALVKKSGINGNGIYQEAENLCDVILRAHQVLSELNQSHSQKKIIFFSHSMFGAACSILLGKCQKIEGDDYLAFDGTRKDGTFYTLPHTVPILL